MLTCVVADAHNPNFHRLIKRRFITHPIFMDLKRRDGNTVATEETIDTRRLISYEERQRKSIPGLPPGLSVGFRDGNYLAFASFNP